MTIKISDIVSTVADVTGVTAVEMQSGSRLRRISRARFMVYFLAREMTDKSFPTIGRCLNTHHTSVLNGAQKAEALREDHPEFAEQLWTCQKILRGERSDDEADPVRSDIRKQWRRGVHVGVIMRNLGVTQARVFEAVQ